MARVLLSLEEKQERRKKSLSKYREKNKEKIAAYTITYHQTHGELLKQKRRVYREANRHKAAKHWADYHAGKLQRTVSWEQELTDFVVEEAHHLRGLRDNLFSFKWDVDHIIPLRGKEVSGLHVWNNFQVIPSSVNRSKGNGYPITK